MTDQEQDAQKQDDPKDGDDDDNNNNNNNLGVTNPTASLKSEEHSLQLDGGRILAYHTFPMAEKQDGGNDNKNNKISRHPVLYFHGFPGCGLEGGVLCARSVAKAGGRLYAIDRPGMGRLSTPYSGNGTYSSNSNKKTNDTETDNNSNLDRFVQGIWELIEHEGWKEFSVIGVSGGGPFTLALLASYLQRRRQDRQFSCRLCNVCLVGAICMSARSDGMKTDLVQLSTLVETASTSWWSRLQLRVAAASTGAIFNYLVPALSSSWMMKLNEYGNKNAPTADRQWLSDERNVLPFLLAMQPIVKQGGNPGVYDDVMIVSKAHHQHEETLREIYCNGNSNNNDGDGDSSDNDLPNLGIFQGELDINVPPSHARYIHESIFGGRSKMFRYDDLGHISTIAGKSDEYAAFATRY